MKKNYQKKKKNFLKHLVKAFLEENPEVAPSDIYERMSMDKATFYSYLREGKNSSPESWALWMKGLGIEEKEFYEAARNFFRA